MDKKRVEMRISLYNLATGPLNGLCSFLVSHFSNILFNFPTIIYLTAIVVYSGRSLSLFSHIQQCFSSSLDYVCWMNELIRDFFFSMENSAKIFLFPFNYQKMSIQYLSRSCVYVFFFFLFIRFESLFVFSCFFSSCFLYYF